MGALDFPLAGGGTGNTGGWVGLLRVGAVGVNGDAHEWRYSAEMGECQLTTDERIEVISKNLENMLEMEKEKQ